MAVAFSPDGKALASAGGNFGKAGELKIWDLATGKERTQIAPFAQDLWDVAWSPDGKRVAVACRDGYAMVVDGGRTRQRGGRSVATFPYLRPVQQARRVGGPDFSPTARPWPWAFAGARGDFYLCPLAEGMLSRAERKSLCAAGVVQAGRRCELWQTRPSGAAVRTAVGGVLRGRGVKRLVTRQGRPRRSVAGLERRQAYSRRLGGGVGSRRLTKAIGRVRCASRHSRRTARCS